jgi:hypothetical protein
MSTCSQIPADLTRLDRPVHRLRLAPWEGPGEDALEADQQLLGEIRHEHTDHLLDRDAIALCGSLALVHRNHPGSWFIGNFAADQLIPAGAGAQAIDLHLLPQGQS